jgi:hypothetical protein
MDRDYEMPDFLSNLGVDLLNYMLKIDTYERYNIDQNPWFNMITSVLRPGLTIGIDKNIID